jgi:pentose-5-phosphate-3-epimerase
MQHLLACVRVSNMSSDHSKTSAFIENHISFSALCDVNHKDYTNKIKRNNALSVLVINYEMSVKDVKKKLEAYDLILQRSTKK